MVASRAMTRACVLSLLLLAPLLSVADAASAPPLDLHRSGGAAVFTFSGWNTGPAAADILEAQGARGTFYVAPGQLRLGAWYSAYMAPEEVAALAARGHDVESMGAQAQDFTTMSADELQASLASARTAIERLTSREVHHVAYPYGALNPTVQEIVQTQATSGRAVVDDPTAYGALVDPFALPALKVTQGVSLDRAKALVDHAANAGVAVIFAFEAITPFPEPNDWTPDDLDALVAYARTRGVAPLTVSELVSGSPPPAIPGTRGTIVFSFDDGSIAQLGAADVLARLGMRGTFYVVSECAKSEANVALCMSASQVRNLSLFGHDVESHTARHRDLTKLKEKQLASELVGAQRTIEGITGERPQHLAYPYGSHNAAVRAFASANYTTGRIFLTNPEPAALGILLATSGADPMLVPGIGVTAATSLERAKAYVDYAVAVNVPIVLVFHDVVSPPVDEFSWPPERFAALAEYVRAVGVPVKTIDELHGDGSSGSPVDAAPPLAVTPKDRTKKWGRGGRDGDG